MLQFSIYIIYNQEKRLILDSESLVGQKYD